MLNTEKEEDEEKTKQDEGVLTRGARTEARTCLLRCVLFAACASTVERWSVCVLTLLGCLTFLQVMRRAATSHPVKMLEYNKGGPVYKNMVGKVSRARFYCTTCKTCICCRNPLWWVE